MAVLPLALIDTSGRLRPADSEQVGRIAESMKEVGLLSPITVRKSTIIVNHLAEDGYGLIAGLHRIEAARSLGWQEIEAHIVDLPDLKRQLAECDENLCGTKLTPSERALFTRRRKEIYEALHPETRHGENQHTRSGQLGHSTSDRFTAETASRTGQSERVVRRDATRGKRIAPEVLSKVTGTKLDTGKTLDELASVPMEKQEAKLEEIIAVREVRSERKPTVHDEVREPAETREQWTSAIMQIWRRGKKEWHREFLERVATL